MGDGDGSSWGGSLVVFAALAALVFVTVGMRVMEIGFYEDDYFAVVPWMDSSWERLSDYILRVFIVWPQGRPLNHSLPQLLGFVGGAAPVPQAVHLIGLAGLLLNGFLVYRVLLRLFAPTPALLGASFYVLFPADTTKLLPIHLAEIQGGMTLVLLGVLAYSRGGAWRVVGYGVAAVSLMAYETTYLPFVFVPLAGAWTSRRELWRTAQRHAVAVGATLALVAAIRLALREGRLVSAVTEPLSVLWRAATAPFIGAAVSGGRCVLAPFEAVGQAPAAAWLSATVGVVAIAAGAWLLSREPAGGAGVETVREPLDVPARWLSYGLAAVFGSYVLSLINYPPAHQFGRLTSVHAAAALGASVLFAGCVTWLRSRWESRMRLAAVPLAVVYLFGLGLFAGLIQDQYARAWEIEREFWASLVRECPDVTSNTAILVTGAPPTQEKAIASFEWADGLVPSLLFDVPTPPPNLVVWEVMGKNVTIERRGADFSWNPRFWRAERIALDLDNVIVVEFVGGEVRRIAEWSVPGVGVRLRSKPRPTDSVARIRPGTLPEILLW